MLEIGDVVKPKIYNSDILFKIADKVNTPFEKNPIYFLKLERQCLDPGYRPQGNQRKYIFYIENAYFQEDELELIKKNTITIKINPHKIIKNKKGENNMKNILDVYKERKRKAIEEKYNDIIKSIKEEDEIQKIVENANRLIQETDPSRKFPEVVLNVYTNETKEDIADMEKAYDMEVDELYNLIQEIEAYFTMTEDFSERKEILKNYNIIDKKGKLVI